MSGEYSVAHTLVNLQDIPAPASAQLCYQLSWHLCKYEACPPCMWDSKTGRPNMGAAAVDVLSTSCVHWDHYIVASLVPSMMLRTSLPKES